VEVRCTALKKFLEQDYAKSAKRKAVAALPSGETRSKRKSLSASQALGVMPRGLRDMVSDRPAPTVNAPIMDAIITTPSSKRARDDERKEVVGEEVPASGTPDPPPKPLRILLRSSLNKGNLPKPVTATVHNPVTIELLGDNKLWAGGRKGTYRWADEPLEDRSACRELRLVSMEASVGAAMCKRHENEEVEIGTIGLPAQSEVVLCGRIVCEGLEGRLNERSILLEGSVASSRGARMRLDAAECERVAAFPGQIVSVLGRSGMTGTTFHARDFLPGLVRELASAPSDDASLHLMVVAGPYCLRDSLDFSPLEQALRYAAREKPQVVIIMGPFLDANNQKVCSGETALPNDDDGEIHSYEELYTEHVLPLLHKYLQPLRRASTEFLVMPSLDEVLCFHPLPQPPLDASLGPGLESKDLGALKRLGVKFLPNPAHLQINGVAVSVTSADALTPILREIVLRPEGRKIEEALRLLLQQRTLFPVVPREPAHVSEARAAALDFVEGLEPQLCIFPSVTGNPNGVFVDNTLFINPGSVCRPMVLGSFAEVWLTPSAVSDCNSKPFGERVRVDIQKLEKL